MGRLILIEGLDLAGKSTAVKGLRERLPGPVHYSRNSLCSDNPIAAVADQLRHDPEHTALEGSCLYVAAHEWDLRHFAPPEQGTHLQDSCWLRALAYDRALGALEMTARWRQSFERWPRFDTVIFLTASLEERRRRYATRAHNDSGDAWVFSSPGRFVALERALREEALAQGGTELDTTGLSKAEVLARCEELIHSRKVRRAA